MSIGHDDAETAQYERLSAGTYTATAWAWIRSKDDAVPAFVERDGEMVARCRFTVDGSDVQAPFSLRPEEIPLLVKAFGGNPKALPSLEADYTAYLVAAQKMGNAGKRVGITVGERGWVARVSGMTVPAGKYRLELVDIRPHNEEEKPEPREGQYGRWFMPVVRVLEEVGGGSIYSGVEVAELLSYGLVVENGQPSYEVTDNGKLTRHGAQMRGFINAFAPGLNSMPQWRTPQNVLPDILEEARSSPRVVTATRYPNSKGRMLFDWVDAESEAGGSAVDRPAADQPSEADAQVDPAVDRPAADQPSEADAQVDPAVDRLYAHIQETLAAAGQKAFGQDGNLTAEGRVWAAENLRPFCQQFGVPKHFGKMGAMDVVILLLALGDAGRARKAFHSGVSVSELKQRLDAGGNGDLWAAFEAGGNQEF